MLLVLFFLFMGHLMTSFLLFAGRSLDCLLLEPGLKPQSLSSGIYHTDTDNVDSIAYDIVDTADSGFRICFHF